MIIWEEGGDTSTPLCAPAGGSTSLPPSVVKPKASEKIQSPERQNFRPFNGASSWELLESEPDGLNKDRQLALFPGFFLAFCTTTPPLSDPSSDLARTA